MRLGDSPRTEWCQAVVAHQAATSDTAKLGFAEVGGATVPRRAEASRLRRGLFLARRVARLARNAPWAAKTLVRRGRPRRLLYYGGGIGDDLLLSAVTFEMKRRGERGNWIMSRWPELFRHNDSVDAAVPIDARYPLLVMRCGGREVEPYYSGPMQISDDRDIPPPPGRHIISCLCQTSGVSGSIALRPYISLTPRERRFGQFAADQIAIQSSGNSAKVPMRAKQWFPERFQELVNLLRSSFTIVQIGHTSDPPLQGAIDLRGKTTLRESAAVLFNSATFIGIVGFLMHLARAVECRSVIVYGGREAPEQSGYSCNENIFTDCACSRCWIYNRCPHEMECMDAIRAPDVAGAVHRQVARHGTPLAVDYDNVPEGPLEL